MRGSNASRSASPTKFAHSTVAAIAGPAAPTARADSPAPSATAPNSSCRPSSESASGRPARESSAPPRSGSPGPAPARRTPPGTAARPGSTCMKITRRPCRADRPRRLDVLLLAQRQHLAANQPGQTGPRQQADHGHHIEEIRSDQRHQDDHGEEERERLHELGQAHEQVVDLAAAVAGRSVRPASRHTWRWPRRPGPRSSTRARRRRRRANTSRPAESVPSQCAALGGFLTASRSTANGSGASQRREDGQHDDDGQHDQRSRATRSRRKRDQAVLVWQARTGEIVAGSRCVRARDDAGHASCTGSVGRRRRTGCRRSNC